MIGGAALSAPVGAASSPSQRAELPLGLPDDVDAAAAILYAEDRREPTADLARIARADDAGLRARAALAIGRIGLPSGAVRLLELLRDPEPEVRALSAFGLGLLELDLEPDTAVAARRRISEALVRALADPDAEVVAQSLWSLGIRADDIAVAAVEAVLGEIEATSVAVHVAALGAWWRLPGAGPRPVVALLSSPAPEVRFAAVTALRRLDDPDALPPIEPLLTDEDASVRAAAARALRGAPRPVGGRHLTRLLRDDDWRVVCAALAWTVSEWQDDGSIDDELLTAVIRASLSHDRHVQRLAFEALALVADDYSVPEDRLFHALEEPDAAIRLAAVDALVSGGRNLLDDSFEALASAYGIDAPPVDASAEAIPSLLRDAPLEAAAVVRALAGIDRREAADWLQILAQFGPAAARAEALRQLAGTDPGAAAARAATMLEGESPVLQAVAAEVVGRLRAAGSLPARDTDSGWVSAIWDAQRAAGDSGALEPRLVLLNALSRLDRPTLERRAAALLPDPDRVIRAWTLRNLRPAPDSRSAALIPTALGPVETGRDAAEYRRLAGVLIELQRRPPRLLVETSRGSFAIDLQPAWAPLTIAAYVDWVEAGFFDGLWFHRVIPDFVIQAGDPTAIGYGGASGSLRSEETPIPYDAGTVGLALAGRDTGGSQFFIVHSAQPHLTGQYPVLGRTASGARTVDRIQPGDTLRIRVADR